MMSLECHDNVMPRSRHLDGMQVNFEIERRFLVRGNEWRQIEASRTVIRQAYLGVCSKASVRVRISNHNTATLTVKSRPAKLRRLELEYTIPTLEAEALMVLRQGSIVEKVRHHVPHGDLTWDVDVFSGENLGLVIAEVDCPMKTSTSICRPGLAKKSRDSGSTTTAPWHSTPSVPGRRAVRWTS